MSIEASEFTVIDTCSIDGGEKGIAVTYNDTTGNYSDNTIIRNSTIFGFSGQGIYVYGSDDVQIYNNTIDCRSGGTSSSKGIEIFGASNIYQCDDTLIYNNMIFGAMYQGVHLRWAPDTEMYFNSIHNTMTNGFGIYIESYDPADVPLALINNAVLNEGVGDRPAIYIDRPDRLPVQMDYNNYYDLDTTFGKIFNTYYSDMSSWRTDTGLDTHSLTAVTIFISASDLHIADYSFLQGRGTAVSVAIDLDGDARADPPDIGADENTNPAIAGFSGQYTIDSSAPTNWPSGTQFHSFADAQA